MLRAILIDIVPPFMPAIDAAYRLSEAESLVKTYGGIVLLKTIQRRFEPEYRTYIGSGKAEELMQDALIHDANIIIVNNDLKPGQIYNLTELYRKNKIEVWDRIDLILKIFQKHAETKEARLEIELASLKHMGPRIFGMGMELSRQGGGIGTKGIGETNTEIMKRHLAKQEKKIRDDLEICLKRRKLQIDNRKRKNLKTISIIGYTNAGKSSLLNTLTKKGALAANKLFATLDTRVGKMYLQDIEQEVLLTDTIGFIADLPHSLINSFRATLIETVHADVLMHVIDSNDPRIDEKMHVVDDVLLSLEIVNKPIIFVFNKIDLLPDEELLFLKEKYHHLHPIFVSAEKKLGIQKLSEILSEYIQNIK